MPDKKKEGESIAAQCDCGKVLVALAGCRSALQVLSEDERLAVFCTLASEHGLSVSEKPPEADDGTTHLHGPDGIEWAREFVSQVVLSDALVGAAIRLDESKREIDGIAKRLELVAADSPAPRSAAASSAGPAGPEPDGLTQLVRDYRAAVNPPLEALCTLAQQLLERAQAGSIDAEIALGIAEESARVAEISMRLEHPSAQA